MNVPQWTPRFCSPVCAVRWPKGGDGDHRCGHDPCSSHAGCGCIAAATGPWPRWRSPACAHQGGAARRRRRDRARAAQAASAGPGRAAQLRTAARGCRQLARPHVVPLLVTRPQATPPPRHPAPARRRPRAACPGRLQRTRCPAHLPRPARVPGRPHPQLQELTGNPDETGDLLRPGQRRLPAGEIPLLPGLACVLAGYDGPPDSDADPASSWPGSQRHCLPRRSNSPRGPRPGVTGRTVPSPAGYGGFIWDHRGGFIWTHLEISWRPHLAPPRPSSPPHRGRRSPQVKVVRPRFAAGAPP